MSSKDDDTLPLPGLSQDLSVDATVDEDFIPTSQPQSNGSSKVSKNSEATTTYKSVAEGSCMTSTTEIDDTIPTDSMMENSAIEKSADFIPDTETKKRKVEYSKEDLACKKKLPVFNAEDIFGTPGELPSIPESPALESQIGVEVGVKKLEESIPEIFVNDSTETVDLDATGNSCSKGTKQDGDSVSGSFNSSTGRCEETQIFDNSSVLLLGQTGKREKIENGVTSQKLYLEETVDDFCSSFQDKAGEDASGVGLTTKLSKEFGQTEDCENMNNHRVAGVPSFKEERQLMNSTPKTSTEETDTPQIESLKIDFKLSVTCLINFNSKTKKITHKLILNVNELPKQKPKPAVDPVSDNASDKSKRYSTSSSGSVYSDKTGLPFPLPKRVSAVSAVSDQTDSSEEGFSKHLLIGKKVLERVPWSNEYLLPLKMDEIIKTTMDQQDFLNRPPIKASPLKVLNCNGLNHPEEVVESFSSAMSSTTTAETRVPTSRETNNSEDVSEKEKTESPPLHKIPEVSEKEKQKTESPSLDKIPEEVIESREKEEEPQNEEEENDSEEIREGLSVFARWTDKRYYSGLLTGLPKNERWDVVFDDGTTKAVKEEFIMPAKWVKAGALVFALIDDKYEPGQIVDVRSGREIAFEVELDTEKKKVWVKRGDLCLTDLMAGLVKENFKPNVATPKGKVSSHIDFDNVLTGKRLREQRTPSRAATTQAGSSGAKKKLSTKGKKTDVEMGRKPGGLTAEGGHLVEDKVISADSPSGNETGETPVRGKAKPRSLSYETEALQGKGKSKWLTPDGIPIPGPSGVKFKKQKTKEGDDHETPTKKSAEKPKRKRKFDEPAEEEVQRKSSKDTDTGRKTRSRKG